MKNSLILIVSLLSGACTTAIEVPAATEFAVPPVLAASSSVSLASGVVKKTYDLVLQHGETEFLPGSPAATMGINGDFLGPVIVVKRGDEVTLNVKNSIGETSTIHWHGLHIPAKMDGGPHQQIKAGATWSPEFTIDNRAGLYWFHPHLEGITGRHVYSGLAGLMIIQDDEEAALDLPRNYGTDDFVVVIQDRRISQDGQLLYMNELVDHAGMRGENILVNGRKVPPLNVPAQRIRLRMLNGSNARFYQLGFSDNRSFEVIASDGGLLAAPAQRTRLEIGTGERYELVVDLSDAQGKTLTLMSYSSELGLDSMDFDELDTSDFNIMSLVVGAANAAPAGPVPSTLSILPDSSGPSTGTDRRFVFAMDIGGVMTINGNTMEMDRIDEVVYLGDTEVWTLVNMSDVPHPVHIHDVQFRVLTRNGAVANDYEAGWKDTVIIHPDESVRVRHTFEDFADPEVPYMYHCHILEHEDRGMMGQFLVKER